MPDDETPEANVQDKVMALIGLAVAAVLAAISIDLLRGPRQPEEVAGGDGGD